jgi:hypothetical protein
MVVLDLHFLLWELIAQMFHQLVLLLILVQVVAVDVLGDLVTVAVEQLGRAAPVLDEVANLEIHPQVQQCGVVAVAVAEMD